MKLIFKKDEKADITVLQSIEDGEQQFSYVDMIKDLITTKELEKPEVSGDFSEAEKNSINSMISFINKEVSTTKE